MIKKSSSQSKLTLVDQLVDSVTSLRSHPVRSFAMSLGVLLGVGTVVATISLSDTARLQVSSTFDSLRATKVDVELDPEGDISGTSAAPTQRLTFPPRAVEEVADLRGVLGAGVYIDIQSVNAGIAMNRLPGSRVSVDSRVLGLTPEALIAAGARIRGAFINQWHVKHSARVALIGAALAGRLGIGPDYAGRSIFVGGIPFVVGGVIEDGGRLPQLRAAVGVPMSAVPRAWAARELPRLLVHVEPGAGPAVARAVPYALDPAAPNAFHAIEPADPRLLRDVVESDLASLGIWLAVVSTLAGVIGIGSSTFGAVYERMEEFGLRRALGARPAHLRRHVLTECAMTGFLAGVAGAILGLAAVVIASYARDWIPTVDPKVVLGAPLLGLLSGLGAGIIPAWKAARIEPAEALRR